MHHVPHPLLQRARRIAAELEWERCACTACAGRGVVGARGEEPEPCPVCHGVKQLWIDPDGGLVDVEELVERHDG